MKLSSLLGFAALLAAFSTVACTNKVIKKAPAEAPAEEEGTPEEEEGEPQSGAKDWAGQPIIVKTDGFDTAEGGVVIIANTAAKRVTARVDPEPRKPGATPTTNPSPFVTIEEKKTQITVACVKASATGLGCKKLTVTVPAGTLDVPVPLTVTSGNGGIKVDGTLTVSTLKLSESGTGTIVAKAKVAPGATIDISAKDSVEVALPEDFAADEVVLAGKVEAGEFPGLANGKPFGEEGVGAKLFKARSTSSVVRIKKL